MRRSWQIGSCIARMSMRWRADRGADAMRATVESLKSSYDVLIVGARSARAATAIPLARAATSLLLARPVVAVLVVEQGRRGAYTLSTLALMRCGVLQLSRWGLID